jgi:mono/diheme cytochrome c family protein
MAMNRLLTVGVVAAVLTGCTAGGENPGTEFSPQMYHAVSYEPLTQIQDKSQGNWLDSNPEDGHGEFYNSNPYNAHGMTMRTPPANTVPRGKYLPYRLEADDVEQAAGIPNPYDGDESIIKDGKALYERFCQHCHGATGQGDGKVGEVYMGVPAYNAGATAELSAGHIFHVITYGIRRMGAHGSQLNEDERWKIVTYVQTLQQLP